jgi:hypothetical protein
MAILRKIRSATLIEALVATVLIVIVFMVASLVLNNLLLNSFTKNTHAAETRIAELEYQLQFGSISLPYNEEFRNWNISLQKEVEDSQTWIVATAVNRSNNKEIIKAKLDAEN